MRGHRDTGSSQQFSVFASSRYFAERRVDLLCDPDSVKSDGKLRGDGRRSSSPRTSALTFWPMAFTSTLYPATSLSFNSAVAPSTVVLTPCRWGSYLMRERPARRLFY